MNPYQIAIIKGDGVGPEVIAEALKVLKALEKKHKISFSFCEYAMGGEAYERFGNPLPDETIKGCLEADGVLFGAVGGERWNHLPRELRPESGLLRLRQELGVFANLRLVGVHEALSDASPLKKEVIDGVDILVVRELIGGIYFGKPRAREKTCAYNTMIYKEHEIRRIAKKAFELARGRKKKVCSVDKANVLEVSEFWREIVQDEARGFGDVELVHMYVDNASMQLIRNPKQFDVLLTSNLFGDILSDEASMLTGSIGLLPSASLGDGVGLYEPIHGSAPDIAGQNIVNPIAAIASAEMMLRYSLGQIEAANAIAGAIQKTLQDGYRTKDLAAFGARHVCLCSEFGDRVVERL